MPKPLTPLAVLLCIALTGPASADPVDALLTEADALARQDGIPAAPLLKKIHEGRAKGVPAPRIRGAVMVLRARLVKGKAVCGPSADRLCIAAAADALAVGADEADLGAVLGRAGAADRVRALVAVATLGGRGMDRAQAVGSVTAALEAGDLDALLAPPGGLGAGGLPSPRAVGRGGELPINNPTRDRDQTGNGKKWGKDRSGKPAHAPGHGNGNGNGNAGD